MPLAPQLGPRSAPTGFHYERHCSAVRDDDGVGTLREFDLLSYLLRHAGAACSRDELLAGVWGIDFETGTNTVDVFVYALRRKLRAAGLPSAIETVRGVGYRLAPDLH